MTEIPKRLTPKSDVLRELFLKSGNLCAFPNCTALMMNEEGVFIGQVCHIEAAELGGERFDPEMTNEERRAVNNLMLMCYPHHTVTNNVEKYPVDKLQVMKCEHELRFSAPDRAILERLTDWTTVDIPLGVQNLRHIDEVLDWRHGELELTESAEEVNAYIEHFRLVPVDVRRFVGAIAQRMYRMRDSAAVHSEISSTLILISDVKSAFQVGDKFIRERITQMDSYGIGDLDQIENDLGPQPAISINSLKSGWPLWLDIVEFCEKADLPIERFTDDLDFSSLDS